MCIVSSLSGAELEYQTKTEGVQCGKRKYFWSNQLLTPSSTHSSCEYEQLWTYCIHLNSICSPVEWSAVGPRLGWGSVESGARSAKRKPAPAGLLWLRVCMAEWEAHGWRHKMKCHMGQNQHSAEKSNLIKPAAKVSLTVYILVQNKEESGSHQNRE